jgi:hypothetical protein
MPFYILTILLQVALIVHCVRTGRNTTWIWVLALLPLAGSLAYLLLEVVPSFTSGRAARRTLSTVQRTFDPSRDLRDAHRQLRTTGSIDARRRFADELLANKKYDEAIENYRLTLTGLYEHDPLLMQGLARAQFEKGDVTAARQTLDQLIAHNPDFKSPESHLLYARALEEEGNLDKAKTEYEVLSGYYPGAEARYRHAVCLKKTGQVELARGLLMKLLDDAELSNRHARKLQKEWLTLAKRELESLR